MGQPRLHDLVVPDPDFREETRRDLGALGGGRLGLAELGTLLAAGQPEPAQLRCIACEPSGTLSAGRHHSRRVRGPQEGADGDAQRRSRPAILSGRPKRGAIDRVLLAAASRSIPRERWSSLLVTPADPDTAPAGVLSLAIRARESLDRSAAVQASQSCRTSTSARCLFLAFANGGSSRPVIYS